MKFLMIVFWLGLTTFVYAQPDSLGTKQWKLAGRLSLDANLQSGNLEQRMFMFTLAPVISQKQFRISPFLQYRLNRVFENVLQDDVFFYFSVDFPYHRRVYFNLSGMYENAALRFVENRWVIGPGLAWKALAKPGNELTMIHSLIYDATDFQVDETRNHDGLRYGLVLNGKYTLIKNKLLLKHDLFYQPKIKNFKDQQRLRLIGNIVLPVSNKLYVNLNLDYIYESVVDVSRKQSNLITSFGLSYQFEGT